MAVESNNAEIIINSLIPQEVRDDYYIQRLAQDVRKCNWSVDYFESVQFVEWVADKLGYSEEQIEALNLREEIND